MGPKKYLFSSVKCFICSKERPEVKLHKLPTDNEMLQKWLHAIDDSQLMGHSLEQYRNARICSEHFEKWCYTSSLQEQLIASAVPFTGSFQSAKSPRKNNATLMEDMSSKRKQHQSAKLLKSDSKMKNTNPSVALDDVPKITKKKRRPNAKVLDESLFWDFVEGIVMTKDRKIEKKISVGCATIAVDWNSIANKNSSQSDSGLSSESSVKFKVHINAPVLNTSVDWGKYNRLCELGSTRARSSTLLKENLNVALSMIDQLKMCVRKLKMENANLQSEKEDPIIRNLLSIKQDAIDGELPAIVLLNKIASYSAQTG